MLGMLMVYAFVPLDVLQSSVCVCVCLCVCVCVCVCVCMCLCVSVGGQLVPFFARGGKTEGTGHCSFRTQVAYRIAGGRHSVGIVIALLCFIPEFMCACGLHDIVRA